MVYCVCAQAGLFQAACSSGVDASLQAAIAAINAGFPAAGLDLKARADAKYHETIFLCILCLFCNHTVHPLLAEGGCIDPTLLACLCRPTHHGATRTDQRHVARVTCIQGNTVRRAAWSDPERLVVEDCMREVLAKLMRDAASSHQPVRL